MAVTTIGPRQVSSSVVRGIVAETKRLGVNQQLRDRLSPQAARLVDSGARAWCDAALTDEILSVLEALRGREVVRELGYATMKQGGVGSVLQPLLSLWLDFVGATPSALYARLSTAAVVVVRGTGFTWEPRGEKAGTVHMRCDLAVPEATWAFWEGVFRFAFDLTRTQGEVSPFRLEDGGRTCHIDVHWDRRVHAGSS